VIGKTPGTEAEAKIAVALSSISRSSASILRNDPV
jgi:hypothetical protein